MATDSPSAADPGPSDRLPPAVDPNAPDPAGTAAPTGPTARQIADAVTAVDGVTGLHGGVFEEVATYLPGGRVTGVVLGDEAAEIHIVVDAAHDLRGVAARVRDVVTDLTGLPTMVTIEDITIRG
ncbi:hypothetical protein AAFP30_01885 [Gordonia sp. CPCC 205515]|uniref:hypothetical protein n=1 Tax=Gordonia sp. CPCC 205515 TaxID=3140791 RepID=UPI003AF33C72